MRARRDHMHWNFSFYIYCRKVLVRVQWKTSWIWKLFKHFKLYDDTNVKYTGTYLYTSTFILYKRRSTRPPLDCPLPNIQTVTWRCRCRDGAEDDTFNLLLDDVFTFPYHSYLYCCWQWNGRQMNQSLWWVRVVEANKQLKDHKIIFPRQYLVIAKWRVSSAPFVFYLKLHYLSILKQRTYWARIIFQINKGTYSPFLFRG